MPGGTSLASLLVPPRPSATEPLDSPGLACSHGQQVLTEASPGCTPGARRREPGCVCSLPGICGAPGTHKSHPESCLCPPRRTEQTRASADAHGAGFAAVETACQEGGFEQQFAAGQGVIAGLGVGGGLREEGAARAKAGDEGDTGRVTGAGRTSTGILEESGRAGVIPSGGKRPSKGGSERPGRVSSSEDGAVRCPGPRGTP